MTDYKCPKCQGDCIPVKTKKGKYFQCFGTCKDKISSEAIIEVRDDG